MAMRSPSHFVDAETSGWRTEDFCLGRLGLDAYLLTYTFDQERCRGRPCGQHYSHSMVPGGLLVMS